MKEIGIKYEKGGLGDQWLKDRDENPEANINIFKDSKQVMSNWDILNTIGLTTIKGHPINPTHDFELLKEARLKLYDKVKEAFIEYRNLNHLKTNEYDLNFCYIAWINNELKVIDKWLKMCNTTSTQLELIKYKHHINSEFKKTEELLEGKPEKQAKPNQTLQSICNEAELKEIRKILIKDKIISKINEDDFLHHFTGQPMDDNINKIEFLCIGKKGNPNKDRLFTLISSLINETSLKDYYNKINYSIRDQKGNKIILEKNNNRFSLISIEFKKLCDQAKQRLKS